ncbi:MAG: hypothetical protein AB1611_19610 [bacterium]
MESYGTYQVSEKKCATCAYWDGERRIELRMNKPTYIQAAAGSAVCMVNKNRKISSINFCASWRLWEKIA